MRKQLLFVYILFFFILGCNNEIKRYNTKENIQSVRDGINTNTGSILKETKTINQEASSITQETGKLESKLPIENKKTVENHLDSIKRSSSTIIESNKNIIFSANEIKKTDSILKLSQSDIINMEKDFNKTVAQRDKAIKERDSQIRKMLNSLIISCIVGAGFFTVIFFLTGSKIGLIMSISSVVTISLAFFVEAYLSYIALIGAGFFVLLIGMLVFYSFKQKKNFEKERKSLQEVIHTVELTKYNLPREQKEKLFGGNNNNGVMDAIQSKETMEAVKQIRDEIPSFLKYIIENNKDKS